MRVTCKHCGGPHPAFECRKRSSGGSSAVEHRPSKSSVMGSIPTRRSRASVQDAKLMKTKAGAPAEVEAEQEVQILRPSPKFDKKAWMRSYQKIYMAKWRKGLVGKKYAKIKDPS